MNRMEHEEPSKTTGDGMRYIVVAVVIFVLIVTGVVYYFLNNKNNGNNGNNGNQPAAGTATDMNEARIASISAENKILSYNVSTNASQIQNLMNDLARVRGTDLASLQKDVSTFAVSQSALYDQLKKWSNTNFAGSAVAHLLNRIDTVEGGAKQLISIQASQQQVSEKQNIAFDKVVYNSNSIQNAITLDPQNNKIITLKPGPYFVTYTLTATPDADWSFVTTDDGALVPGSELSQPLQKSTAFVIEVAAETNKIEIAVQTNNSGTFTVTYANVVIFAI